METTQKEIQLSPDTILVVSRHSAEVFHNQVKELIYESGKGLFQYLETIAFFSKLNEVIKGKDDKPGDQEFIDYVRQEIGVFEGKKFLSPRGVRFENAEVGTRYDYSACNDPELPLLEKQLESIKEKIEARKEFLKRVPKEGLDLVCEGGEVVKLYPPLKTSKSSYKITLAK